MPEFHGRFSSQKANFVGELMSEFIFSPMSNLLQTYGSCIIPKGTILFRSNTPIHPNQIFFALHIKVAGDYNEGDKRFQIWKILSDIEVLFMISGIRDSRAWIKSSITEIYCKYFPEDICTPEGFYLLEIKHYDKKKLQRLINKMKEENIKGWFSSIEDKVEPEICLFNKEKIQLIETIDSPQKYILYNALKKMRLMPANNFYENSKEFTADFKTHLKWYNYTISTAPEYVQQPEEARYEYFNLRLKLKI